MAINRENFDYQGYLGLEQAANLGIEPEAELTNENKDAIYRQAFGEYVNEVDSRPEFKSASSKKDAQWHVLDNVDDARELLGFEEANLGYQANAESFMAYAKQLNDSNSGRFGDVKTSALIDKYTNEVIDNFNYPQYRSTEKGLDKILKASIKSEIDKSLGVEGEKYSDNEFNLDDSLSANLLRFESRIAKPADPVEQVEESEIEEQPGGFENVGRGIGSGVLDTAGKTVEGVDTLGNIIGANLGEIRFFGQNENGETEFIQFNSADDVRKAAERNGSFSFGAIGDIGNSIQGLGKDIAEGADQDSTLFTVGNVAGQLAVFAGTALVGGAAAGASTAVTSGVEFQLDDLESVLVENGETFDPATAEAAALWGGAVGSLESLPAIQTATRLLGGRGGAAVTDWLNKASDGAVLRLFKQGATGAIEEGLQEVVSQVASNLVASNIVAYDKERSLWVGTAEAAQVGGAAGAVLNGLAGLIGGRRAASNPTPKDTPPVDDLDEQIGVAEKNAIDKGRVEPTLTDDPVTLDETPTVDDAPVDQPVTLDETPVRNDDGSLSSDEAPIVDPVTFDPILKTDGAPFSEKSVKGQVTRLTNANPDFDFVANPVDGGFEIVQTPKVVEPETVAEAEPDGLNAADDALSEDPVVDDALTAADDLLVDDVEDELTVADDALAEADDELLTDEELLTESSQFNVGEDFNLNNADQGVITSIDVNADGDTIALVTEPDGRENEYNLTNPRKDVGDDQIVNESLASRSSENVEVLEGDGDQVVVTKNGSIGVGETQEIAFLDMLRGTKDRQRKRKAARKAPGPKVVYSVESEGTSTRLIDFKVKRTESGGVLTNSEVTLKDPDTIEKSLDADGFKNIVLDSDESLIEASKGGVRYKITVAKKGKSQARVLTVKGNGKTVGNPITIIDKDGVNVAKGNFDFTTTLTGALADTVPVAGTESGRFFDPSSFKDIARKTKGKLTNISAKLAKIDYPDGQQIVFRSIDSDRVSVRVNDQVPEIITRDSTLKNGKRSTSMVVKATKVKAPKAAKAAKVKKPKAAKAVKALDSLPPKEPTKVPTQEDLADVVESVRSRVNGQGIIDNGDTRVVLESQSGDAESLAHDVAAEDDIDVEAALLQAGDESAAGPKRVYDWTPDEIMKSVRNMVPPEIFKLIRFYTDKNNPLNNANTRGRFIMGSDNQGRYFQIDLSDRTKSEEQVLATISHELGHLTQESLVTRDDDGNRVSLFKEMYDKMYTLVKDELVQGYGAYFDLHKIDPNNPTDAQKLLLINEYLAEQQTTMVDYLNTGEDKSEHVNAANIQAIKKKLAQGNDVTNIILDMTKDLTGDADKARTVQLIEGMLTAQAAKSLGKAGFTVTYKQFAETDSDIAEIRVTSTRYGSKIETIANNVRARKNSENKSRKAYIEANKHAKDFATRLDVAKTRLRLTLSKINPWDLYLGDELASGISSGDKSGMAVFRNGLNRDFTEDQRNQMNLNRYGIARQGPNDKRSYEQMFLDAGVTDTEVITQAKVVDQRIIAGVKDVYNGAADVHGEYDNMLDLITKWRDNGLMTAQSAATMNSALRARARKIKGNYSHDKYKAHTVEDQPNLAKIRGTLTGGKIRGKLRGARDTINDDAADAQKQLDEIEASKTAEDVLTEKLAHKMAVLRNNVDLKNRRDSLESLARARLAERGVTLEIESTGKNNSVRLEMLSILDNAIRTTNEIMSHGLIKTKDVDAAKAKKLNPDVDMDEITFLGLISDPADQLRYTKEQQFFLKKALSTSSLIARLGVEGGVFGVKGDPSTEVSTVSGLSNISSGQPGTLLEFMDVDDAFVKEVNIYLNTLKDNQRTALIKTIELAKSKFTVTSIKSGTGNYFSIPAMLAGGGYAQHLFNFRRGSGSNLKNQGKIALELWRRDNRFTGRPDDDFASTVVTELNDHNLTKKGESSFDIQRADPRVLQTVVRTLTETMESIVGAEGSMTGRQINQKLAGAIHKVTQLYAFPDDIAKIVPYVVNRGIYISEARRKIERSDFASDTIGEADYGKAIATYASTKAAAIVRSDTVSVDVNAPWVQKLVSSNQTVFVNNFITHFSQMVRVMGNWHINVLRQVDSLKEVQADLADAQARGASVDITAAKKEINQHRSRIAARLAGLALVDTSVVASNYLGASGMSLLTTLLADGFAEDEEVEDKKPLEERTKFTDRSREAADHIARMQGILRGFGSDRKVIGTRNGTRLIVADLSRISPPNSFNINRDLTDPTLAEGAGKYLYNVVTSLVNLGGGETFFQGFLLALAGKSPYGKELDEGAVKAWRDWATYYIIDGPNRRAISQLWTKRDTSGKIVPRASTAAHLATGVPNAVVDTDDVLSEWSRFRYQQILGSRSDPVSDLNKQLRIPSVMTTDDIQRYIDRMDKLSTREDANMQKTLTEYRAYGYSEARLKAVLKESGLSVEYTDVLLSGRSPFRTAASKYVKGQLEDSVKDKKRVEDPRQAGIVKRNYALAQSMLRN